MQLASTVCIISSVTFANMHNANIYTLYFYIFVAFVVCIHIEKNDNAPELPIFKIELGTI